MLVAVHWSQVTAARTARMYALGAFLTALSSWILLRALRASGSEPSTLNPRRSVKLSWTAYGISVAAFLYTHNYAFFTVAAQALFVAALLIVGACRCRRRALTLCLSPKGRGEKRMGTTIQSDGQADSWRAERRACRSTAGTTAAGFACGVLLAAVLYSPWAPGLRRQVSQVREGYWIGPVSRFKLEEGLWSWITGWRFPSPVETCAICGFLTILLARVACRTDRSIWFCSLLAFVPWLLSVGFSFSMGQSIFLERCLVFANVGLCALLALLTFDLAPGIIRFVFTWLLGATCLGATIEKLLVAPSGRPGIVNAIEYLRGRYDPKDGVLVAVPSSVNVVRYYAKQARFEKIEVKARVSPFSKGHQVHVASLDADDVYWDDSELADYERIWTAGEDAHAVTVPQVFLRVESKTFGSGASRYALVLYERKPDEPAGKR
jgi:hypothetical protein